LTGGGGGGIGSGRFSSAALIRGGGGDIFGSDGAGLGGGGGSLASEAAGWGGGGSEACSAGCAGSFAFVVTMEAPNAAVQINKKPVQFKYFLSWILRVRRRESAPGGRSKPLCTRRAIHVRC